MDADAKILKNHGNTGSGCKVQIAVDKQHKLIVAEHIPGVKRNSHMLTSLPNQGKSIRQGSQSPQQANFVLIQAAARLRAQQPIESCPD